MEALTIESQVLWGVSEIGGNKILLEDCDTRVFLDFGMSACARSDLEPFTRYRLSTLSCLQSFWADTQELYYPTSRLAGNHTTLTDRVARANEDKLLFRPHLRPQCLSYNEIISITIHPEK